MKAHRSYSDHEIARYVLGLDMAEHAGEIQARLARDDAAAARALKWEAYFLDIVDALPASPPPPAVLARIQATLGMEDEPVREDARPHPAAAGPAEEGPAPEAPEPPAARRRAPRPRRVSKRRVLLAAGAILVLAIAILLGWAALKPAPSGTLVQQPLHLQSQ
jgi:anti-sigma-K factor RskA